jgi:hypothetical protein
MRWPGVSRSPFAGCFNSSSFPHGPFAAPTAGLEEAGDSWIEVGWGRGSIKDEGASGTCYFCPETFLLPRS